MTEPAGKRILEAKARPQLRTTGLNFTRLQDTGEVALSELPLTRNEE